MNTLVRQLATENSLPTLLNTVFGDAYVTSSMDRVPPVNLKETEESFELYLAAPGVNKEDFKINLHNRRLSISSEVTSDDGENEEQFTRKEFSFKSFSRSFVLPKSADDEGVEASYEDGILKVSIAKKEEAKAKEPKLISVA